MINFCGARNNFAPRLNPSAEFLHIASVHSTTRANAACRGLNFDRYALLWSNRILRFYWAFRITEIFMLHVLISRKRYRALIWTRPIRRCRSRVRINRRRNNRASRRCVFDDIRCGSYGILSNSKNIFIDAWRSLRRCYDAGFSGICRKNFSCTYAFRTRTLRVAFARLGTYATCFLVAKISKYTHKNICIQIALKANYFCNQRTFKSTRQNYLL